MAGGMGSGARRRLRGANLKLEASEQSGYQMVVISLEVQLLGILSILGMPFLAILFLLLT